MVMTPEKITELKLAFARSLAIKPDDSYLAAFRIFPDSEIGLASEAAAKWPLDPFVIAEVERLTEEGVGIRVPSKTQQAYDIYQIANNPNIDPEIRVKAHEVFAKVMGHIERPTVNNGIIQNSNKVMIVRVSSRADGTPLDESEWEEQAALSQKTLQGN